MFITKSLHNFYIFCYFFFFFPFIKLLQSNAVRGEYIPEFEGEVSLMDEKDWIKEEMNKVDASQLS